MKIYNTSCFEKLKIRAVDMNKLSISNIIIERLDPNEIKIQDIRYGYICRTSEHPTKYRSNIWVYVNPSILECLFLDEEFEYGGFVTLDTTNPFGVSYLYIEDYKDTFPISQLDNYIAGKDEYNIIDIWEPTEVFIDELMHVENVEQFINFFEKYNLRQYENI